MNMIYNSPIYCVVEFELVDGANPAQVGFEIMDKAARREIFIGGALAERFREDVAQLVEGEPSTEEIDDYLSTFESLMQQPLLLH